MVVGGIVVDVVGRVVAARVVELVEVEFAAVDDPEVHAPTITRVAIAAVRSLRIDQIVRPRTVYASVIMRQGDPVSQRAGMSSEAEDREHGRTLSRASSVRCGTGAGLDRHTEGNRGAPLHTVISALVDDPN